MKILFLIPTLILTSAAYAIEVSEPEPQEMKSISFTSPDDKVKTLGTAEFILDLSAGYDDMIELAARRQNLTLANGEPVSAFAYSKEAGVIIGSVAPITQISIREGKDNLVFALFHNDKNEVLVPRRDQVQIFDMNSFKPVEFDYTPLSQPKNASMNVDVLIDISGSMENALPAVRYATNGFMSGLPSFTNCNIFTFNDMVTRLTPNALPCVRAVRWLPNFKAGGKTALHSAIKNSLEGHAAQKTKYPALTIIVTDGKDTQNPEITLQMLKELKAKSHSKILVFWAGSYDPNYLQGLADIEMTSDKNIQTDLERFFTSIGISINGLQTITLK